MNKKILLCYILSLLFLNFIHAKGNKKFLIDEKGNEVHKIQLLDDGRPYLTGNIFLETGEKYTCFFMLDIGMPKTSIYIGNTSENIEKFNNCKCEFNDFSINNISLTADNVSHMPIILNKMKCDITGIIGTDILMSENFYLSLTKKEFGWFNKFEKLNKNTVSYKLIPFEQKELSNLYQIEIEDNFFKSNEEEPQYLSENKAYSKYFLDTGSYFIFTSYNDYESIVSKKHYQNIYYKSYHSPIGVCLIENAKIFGKDFINLQANGGNFGKGQMKVLGCQILSAFDLYFCKNESNQISEIKMNPVDSSEYIQYRTEHDNQNIIPQFTYGFLFETIGKKTVVSHKAFLNGKEILPKVKIGDEVISINGEVPNLYTADFFSTYGEKDSIDFVFLHKKKKYKIHAKKINVGAQK